MQVFQAENIKLNQEKMRFSLLNSKRLRFSAL